jgi:choline-sulfatase
LGILGLHAPEGVQGADITKVLAGGGKAESAPRYCESRVSELGFGMAPLYGVVWEGLKYIRAPRPELYDLRADPGETRNLYAGRSPAVVRLGNGLDAVLRRGTGTPDEAANPMNRETEEALRSLGYLARPDERSSAKGIDPKDGLPIYNLLEEARHRAQRGDWPAAEEALNKILDQAPGHIAARNTLALALLNQGRSQEAREQCLRSLRDEPAQSRVYLQLGNISLLEGELAAARTYLKKALELTPGFVEAMSNLGMVSLLEGDEKGAQEWYGIALRQDPGFPAVYRRMADLYFERGDFATALAWYQKALARSPRDFRSLVQLGNCLRRLGEAARAAERFREAGALNPESWVPDYNLACLLGRQGRATDALASLKKALEKGFDDPGFARHDPDLESLHELPAFTGLLSRISGQGE